MFPPRRILPAIIVLLAGVFCGAHGQTCNLKPDQLPAAPELYGFRLGMTGEEAKTKVPLMRLGRPDEFGVVKTSINPSFDPRFDQTTFAGARTISVDFLDDRLVTLWIGYDERFKWQKLDEFVAGISKSLNLQAPFISKRGGQELTCDGLSIFVSLIAGSPSLRITDQAAQETIANRREEAAAAAELMVIADKKTKLFYPSDCDGAAAVPEPERLTFKSKEEAEKAGYKLAKDCQ